MACANNPDGFGFAIRINDGIITSRGLNAKKVIDKFFAIRKAHPDSDAMFHARITTHGTVTNENCHPFRVAGDPRLVLGHNGILPMQVPIDSNRSDTRIFANDILPAMGIEILDSYADRTSLEDWLGSNKLVIMSTHPALKDNYYILNEHHGVYDGGVWYSNCSYRPYIYKPIYNYSNKYILDSSKYINDTTSWGNHWDDTGCQTCGNILNERDFYEGYCLVCETCLDCMSTFDECLCYSMSKSERAYETSKHW